MLFVQLSNLEIKTTAYKSGYSWATASFTSVNRQLLILDGYMNAIFVHVFSSSVTRSLVSVSQASDEDLNRLNTLLAAFIAYPLNERDL